MNKNLNLPAECAVLSREEMTYTEGGGSSGAFGVLGMAATAVGAVVLASSYVWGIGQARNWLNDDSNHTGNFLTVAGRALDAVLADMAVSPSNFVRDAVSTTMVVGLAPLSAILLLIK